jgi:hypothetical protein
LGQEGIHFVADHLRLWDLRRLSILDAIKASLDALLNGLPFDACDGLVDELKVVERSTVTKASHLEGSVGRFEMYPDILDTIKVRAIWEVEDELDVQICSCPFH